MSRQPRAAHNRSERREYRCQYRFWIKSGWDKAYNVYFVKKNKGVERWWN